MTLKQSNYNTFFKFFLFLLFLFVFNNCSENKPTEPNEEIPTSSNLSVGETVLELTEDIGSSGGTIKISNSESKLNGMEIKIPENAHGEPRTYKISSSQILEHKFGEYFDPASPMIIIENGGGYSKTPIQIKIPINKEDDTFLMGFFYDEITGELEALPVLELTDSYIITETRHFAMSSIVSSDVLEKSTSIKETGNIIISVIKDDVISNQTVINSNFTPGIDDWEFFNFGSYISPFGHCAGQSITAMWYYKEKRLNGEPGLFHLFDTYCESDNPSFIWHDNPLGYRLSSSVQEDAVWGSFLQLFQDKFTDYLVWKTFITSMLVTKNPQFVGIYNTTEGGGHAIIVYKIDVPAGKLYISDPNYPNNRATDGTSSIRVINYSNNKFQPYPSYAKVGDKGIEYDKIRFFSSSANFNWTKIGERFKEFEEKTIGNDRLADYELLVNNNDDETPFIDGMTIIADEFKFYCRNENIPLYLSGTDNLQLLKVFDHDGKDLGSTNEDGFINIQLNKGTHKLGVAVYGQRLTNSKLENHYYDFKWINFNFQEPEINNPLSGFKKVAFNVFLNIEQTKTSDFDGTTVSEKSLRLTTSFPFGGSFSGNTFSGILNFSSTTDTIFGSFSATINSSEDLITNVEYDYFAKSKDDTYFNNFKTSIKAFNIPFSEEKDGKIIFKLETDASTCENISYLEDTFETWYQNEKSWATGYSCDENSIIEVTFYKE